MSFSSYLPMASYNGGLLLAAERSLQLLKDVDYNVIAVRGVSGVAVGAIVSAMVDKPLCVVRKPHDDTHGCPVEGPDEQDYNSEHPLRWVFLDDLISTGNTFRHVMYGMRRYNHQVLVGGAFYSYSGWMQPDELHERIKQETY